MSVETKEPIDIQPYEDLAQVATTREEILMLREMLMEDNKGSVEVTRIDPNTGEQSVIPVTKIGEQTLASINEATLREVVDPRAIDVNSEPWRTERD